MILVGSAGPGQAAPPRPGLDFEAAVGLAMVWVPPLPGEDEGFWVARDEVDMDLIRKVRPATRTLPPGVGGLSWLDARETGYALTRFEQAAGRLPEGWEYALPSEAEWEHAASAAGSRLARVSGGAWEWTRSPAGLPMGRALRGGSEADAESDRELGPGVRLADLFFARAPNYGARMVLVRDPIRLDREREAAGLPRAGVTGPGRSR